ncbi:DUF4192 domain-containing protein [Corynebacterium nasicanis]|uniref:DUF4192 domain-containing protein n=1 Tax=Corynebacterium nasicanis TaxID=1448267 RepID=A0ABW1Q7M7_9CORY
MTTATTALTSPGQIAANLPGILGFYPHDSLVFVTFTVAETAHRYELGPVLRIDLDQLDILPELARAIDDTHPDMVFGYIVTTRPEAEIADIIRTLHEATEESMLDLDLAWVTPEILTGEPVTLGFSQSPEVLPPLGTAWWKDVVAPVVVARAMAPLLAQGELPELNREEAQEHLRHGTPHHEATDCAQLTAFALDRAQALPEARYPALAADARLLIDESRDLPLAEILAEEEVLLTMATLLGTAELRDLIIEDILAVPAAGAPLMLAVARTFTGLIRHNALCVYALCMVELGLSMRTSHALLAALEEDPTHMLARLLLAPAQRGEFSFMVSSVREGSRIVRARHGVEEDSAA